MRTLDIAQKSGVKRITRQADDMPGGRIDVHPDEESRT